MRSHYDKSSASGGTKKYTRRLSIVPPLGSDATDVRVGPEPQVHAGQRSLRLATLSTRDSAYQGLPSAAIAIPIGSGRFGSAKSIALLDSVIT